MEKNIIYMPVGVNYTLKAHILNVGLIIIHTLAVYTPCHYI